MWCGGGAGPFAEKKIFVSNMIAGCILTQFLTGRKDGQSLETMGHGF